MPEPWPQIPFESWRATCDTLHAHTQVLGKLAAGLAPPEPQLQHAALRLTARGWETAPLPAPDGSGAVVVLLDLRVHEAVVEHSGGWAERIPLTPDRAVGEVTRDVLAAVRAVGGAVRIDPAPQEVPLERAAGRPTTSTPAMTPPRSSDYFAAATRAAMVLAAFRAPYRGRSTQVNAWWGSFDLAVSLFSGEPADPPSADFIMRNAMDSQEVAVGWWPGDPRHPRAAFYAFAHPAPEGFPDAAVRPAAARWDGGRGGIHPRLGRRPGGHGPARGGAGVRPLGVPARVPVCEWDPGARRQRRRDAAAGLLIRCGPGGVGPRPDRRRPTGTARKADAHDHPSADRRARRPAEALAKSRHFLRTPSAT